MTIPERNSYGVLSDTIKVASTSWLKTLFLVGVLSGLFNRGVLTEDLGRVSITPLVSVPPSKNLAISTGMQYSLASESSARALDGSSDRGCDHQDKSSGVPLEITAWFEPTSNGLEPDVTSSFRGRLALHPEYALERIEVSGGMSTQQFVYVSGQRVRIEQGRQLPSESTIGFRTVDKVSIHLYLRRGWHWKLDYNGKGQAGTADQIVVSEQQYTMTIRQPDPHVMDEFGFTPESTMMARFRKCTDNCCNEHRQSNTGAQTVFRSTNTEPMPTADVMDIEKPRSTSSSQLSQPTHHLKSPASSMFYQEPMTRDLWPNKSQEALILPSAELADETVAFSSTTRKASPYRRKCDRWLKVSKWKTR